MKVSIVINNENVEVDAVRNFKIDNNKYFIYTLNQIDEQNYQILYVVKVVNSDNILLGSGMLEETEWVKFVETIKEIIKKNREDADLPIEDLNINNLQNLTINEGRPFKLRKEMVELLSKNIQNLEAYDDLIPKQEINQVSEEQIQDSKPEITNEPKQDVDYQKLYEEANKSNEELKKQNEILLEKINKIKEMINGLV